MLRSVLRIPKGRAREAVFDDDEDVVTTGHLPIDPLRGKRVLLLAEFGVTGGTRTYLEQLLSFYRKQGSEVLLVPGPNSEVDARLESLLNQYSFSSLLSPFLKPPKASRLTLGVVSERVLREQQKTISSLVGQGEFDIVVASAGTPGEFLGAMRCELPRLYILHTYPHGRRAVALRSVRFPKAVPPGLNFVAVSQSARDHLVNAWRLGLRNDCSVDVVYSTAGAVLDVPAATATLNVLCVGAVERYKGPDLWIDVMDRVIKLGGADHASFTWVGGGSLLKTCRQEVARRGLADRINFVGPQLNVNSYYSAATIHTLFSSVESLGLAVLDASRRGIPSIVSNVGGLPETVDAGHSGIVAGSRSVDALSIAVWQLLGDEALRSEMGTRAREFYLKRFSDSDWERHLLSAHAKARA